jgi:hypothetical protein
VQVQHWQAVVVLMLAAGLFGQQDQLHPQEASMLRQQLVLAERDA